MSLVVRHLGLFVDFCISYAVPQITCGSNYVFLQVTQVVARELGIDLNLVSIQPTQAICSANSSATGGSVGSELVCMVSEALFSYKSREEMVP